MKHLEMKKKALSIYKTRDILRSLFFIFFLGVLLTACGDDSNGGGSSGPTPPDVNPEDVLPQFVVESEETIVDEPKVNARLTVDVQEDRIFDGNIAIEFRGATSQQIFPKKSFGFETRDAMNEDLDTTFFDMPEEEDWILNGPYSDKTFIRNVLIYDFAREMGQYASRTELVELTVNGEYLGIYVLMEKLKRDNNRIDISKLNPDENSGEDLTGGYILKIDKVEGNNLGDGYNALNSFNSRIAPPSASGDIRFLYEYPDAEDITSEQKTYIQDYMHAFEAALNGPEFMDEENGYAAYINVESFIDFFLLNEVSRNVDGYRLSTFMHKDKNGKLNMGPIWDFNIAFGNANYCTGPDTDGWMYRFNEYCPGDFWLAPFWWGRLLEDPAYVDQLKNRWSMIRASVLSRAAVEDKIDSYSNQLVRSGAVFYNDQKWGVIGTEVWPNNFVGATYDDEVQYLKSWLLNRIDWMDQAIDQL